ncbi:MAG TPA: transporter substrate-binding domain-containing protein, partial [Spirochaetota bacterium]|nr:transporter substrate-binding domain-containing protein [Spirochaetota bacterium]
MKNCTAHKTYAAYGIVLLALVIAIPIQAAGEKAEKAQRILARGDYAYPPYEFIDSSGMPAGYNVDLMRAIARVMGLDVEIRLGPWAEVRGDLEKKKIDMLLGMYHSP